MLRYGRIQLVGDTSKSAEGTEAAIKYTHKKEGKVSRLRGNITQASWAASDLQTDEMEHIYLIKLHRYFGRKHTKHCSNY